MSQWRAEPAQQRLTDENETRFYGLSRFDQSFPNGGLSISTNGGASFGARTTFNSGLINNTVTGVYASGDTIYAATSGGLSVSTNGGTSFTAYTTANGLGSNTVNAVHLDGPTVYAATAGGLSTAVPVPGPLPLLGAATALNFCRRLRGLRQRLPHAAGCRLA